MRHKANRSVIIILVAVAMLLICFAAPAETTNWISLNDAKNSNKKIRTVFPGDLKLTKQEIAQVVKLARQNGITNPAEVRIFYFLPGGGNGVTVKSGEVHEGRNTRFETVYIYKVGWSCMETNSKSKLLGNFWVDEDGKISTLLRDYKSTNGTVFQVSVGKGVGFSIADKLVESYLVGKLFPEHKYSQDLIEPIQIGLTNLENAKPKAIRKIESEKCFEMEFDNYPTTVVKLKIEKDKIVIIRTSEYVI